LGGAEQVKELLEKARKPKPSPESAKAKIAELAKLDHVAYELQRIEVANQLGMRQSIFDAEVDKLRPQSPASDSAGGKPEMFEKVKPCPDPVDGDAMLSDLTSILTRYCSLPDGAAVAVAFWTVHAYTHDAFDFSPILAITSPEKRCGKTTLMRVLLQLVYKPLQGSSITTAVLFRAIELWRPTLLLDEADTYLKGNEELRGMINSGHEKSFARAWRVVGDNRDMAPQGFCTWAPKAIALIGKMQDTLTDRSIEIPMRRKLPGERVKRIRSNEAGFLELRRKLTRWGEDYIESLRGAKPAIPEGLDNRARDNWEPLLAIAEKVGGEWPQKALAALSALALSDGEDESLRATLLGDIKNLFENEKADRIASKDLTKALGEMEDRPWPEFRNGKEITTRQMAKLLKPFSVTPKLIRDGGEVFRGYIKKDFTDAFSRYLPNLSVTALQTNAEAGLRDIPSVTIENAVTDGNRPEATVYADCNTVTDENREYHRQRV